MNWKSALMKAVSNLTGTAQLIPSTRSLPPRRGTKEFLQAYRSSPWLRAGANLLSNRMAAIEWQVWSMARQTEEPLEIHPILDFLQAGCPTLRLSGYMCRKITSVHLELAGEAFWFLERTAGRGVPVAYMPLPPHWVTDIPRPGRDVYEVQVPNGAKLEIAASEVIWFKDPDAENPHERGSAIAASLADELDTDEAAAKHLATYLFNKARPDIIITGTDQAPLSKEEAKAIEASWTQKFGGPQKSGKPFFSTGSIDIKEIGASLKDLELVPLRAYERDIIVSVWGIPPECLGIILNSNRATIDAADTLLAKNNLVPRATMWREALQLQLAPLFGKGLWIDFVSPVQEDKEFRLKVQQAFPFAFTINELRETGGAAPLEGPNGDYFAKPFTYSFDPTLDSSVEQSPGADQVSDNDVARLEEPKTFQGHKKKALTDEDFIHISDAVDDPLVMAKTQRALKGLLEKLIAEWGEEALRNAGSEVQFTINQAMRDFIEETSGDRITGTVNQTTREAIRGVLQAGTEAGSDVDEIAAGIRTVFRQANDVRSRLIAETEMTRATNAATLEAINQGGFENKIWLTTRDGHARDTHMALDGEVVGLRENFRSESGASGQGPGMFGDPSEDCNCRCAVEAALPGLDTEDRRAVRWTEKDARRRPYDKLYRRTMISMFDGQEAAVLKRLKQRS